MATVNPTSLAAQLLAAAPPLSEREQHLAISLYRLLAEGSEIARRMNRGRYPSILCD